jgi:EAL domain-containing protein (putative c-di-GMP-specific phosphodiesterase class I)
MRDAQGHLHMPGNFIPTAEQFGLIREVDKVIIRKAIRELAKLPICDKAISFSINLSGLSLGDPEVLELIEREVHDNGIYPERLNFEVTETTACENMTMAIDFMQRIREMGCRVSLDDFGVGFSSFSYLKHMRVDCIKIDGSFIRNIHSSTEDQLFVKALVDVARGMGIRTTAEFVENAEALHIVRSLGVDYAQGYFIGKPTGSILHDTGYSRKAG